MQAPTFTSKDVGQTTCWPESENCVTVNFQANVNMAVQSKVYIAGFSGVDKNTSLSSSHGLSTFDAHRKLITVSYDQSSAAANAPQWIKMCFSNPPQAQRAPAISIWAKNLCGCAVKIAKMNLSPSQLLEGKECFRALTVQSPAFIVKEIVL